MEKEGETTLAELQLGIEVVATRGGYERSTLTA